MIHGFRLGRIFIESNGWSVSLSSDGIRVAVGASLHNGSGELSGHDVPSVSSRPSTTSVPSDLPLFSSTPSYTS